MAHSERKQVIGVVGGGQLAMMLAQIAVPAGYAVKVLDPTQDCPATTAGATQILGDLHDAEKIGDLVRGVDVTTVDLENVNAEALASLADQGHRIIPQPRVLGIIANKLEQKQMFARNDLPTSRFEPLPEPTPALIEAFGLPAVQKAARGGYDGRGVALCRTSADLDKMLPVPGFVEAYVEHEIEIGVMVGRRADGECCTWPVTEMHFNQEGNLLDYLVAPARVPQSTQDKARDLAVSAVEALDGVGIFGVEMFLNVDGELTLNEMAPRTHNSGHYTIDACVTSQFEQQLNLLCDQPLGDTKQHHPAAMVNLLGATGYTGDTVVEGADPFITSTEVFVHLYGKHECRPLRKMGHLTALGDSVEEALERAQHAANQIIVRGANKL
jgi:5-(carboxyamino)imidazole ribonucleotide synthase